MIPIVASSAWVVQPEIADRATEDGLFVDENQVASTPTGGGATSTD